MKQEERTARTRAAIVEAYWSLYRDDLPITAKDVADRAGINRSTLYLYFGSTSEILDAVKDDLVESWREMFVGPVGDMNDLFSKLEQFVSMYGEKVFYLIGPNGDPSFPDTLKTMMLEALRGTFSESDSDEYRLTVEFTASGLIGVVRMEYAEHGRIRADVVSRLVRTWLGEGVLAAVTGDGGRVDDIVDMLRDDSRWT